MAYALKYYDDGEGSGSGLF